jgi:acyl-CoA thioester hydrolase
VLSLHVDLAERKVCDFNKERLDLMNEFISKNKDNFQSDQIIFKNKLKK